MVFSKDLVREQGNVLRPGPVPRFSDLEVIAMSMAAESEEIDSENWLFEAKLKEWACGKRCSIYSMAVEVYLQSVTLGWGMVS